MDEHDLTDPHGEAEALRKENARLRRNDAILHDTIEKLLSEGAQQLARAEAAEAALAASRAPDPAVNAGSCQPGDLISRAAAIEALGFAAWKHQGTDAYSAGMDAGARHQAKQDYDAIRALPAAPVAEAQPTIGGAQLDALVDELRGIGGPGYWADTAADAITALRAQPDWKAMAERLGDVLDDALSLQPLDDSCDVWAPHARAALSDLAAWDAIP